ncbi:MAG: DUF4124 domain-containing protein [Myxococcota bacterium]
MRTLPFLALLAAPAFAQTVYSWEDQDGVHYTDDLSQVPKAAKVEVQTIDAAPSRPATPSSPSAATAATAPVSSAPRPAANDERAWRERFVTANRRIATLKQELAALQTSLPSPTTCVTTPVNGPLVATPVPTPPGTNVVVVNQQPRCQPNPLYERMKVHIEQKKVAVRDAELDLEQLERQASYDAVPREWRRGW